MVSRYSGVADAPRGSLCSYECTFACSPDTNPNKQTQAIAEWQELEAVLVTAKAPGWLWDYVQDWHNRGAVDARSLCGLRRP